MFALLALIGCGSLPTSPPVAMNEPRALAAEKAAGSWHHALVIDASSSASSLQSYQWRPVPNDGLPQIEPSPFPRRSTDETWELKVKPGLSAYTQRPEEAARSLQPLIDFALDKLGDDPETLRNTSLFLRATAGMRLLPLEEQSEILAAVEEHFDRLPFGRSSARVISGEEEGVYGWIAVNYVLGHLEHGGPFPTVGALDLGGASSQITFVPLDYPRSHGRRIRIGHNDYYLYTSSYLGAGQDEAREAIASRACFLLGYPTPAGEVGTGEFDTCRRAIRDRFERPCDDGPCSLFGVYQPPLYGEFLAFSVYAYAADFFDLGERLVPDLIAERGAEFCARDWTKMVAEDPDLATNPYVPNYCYAAAHIVTMLTDGFGFSTSSERITAPLRVQGSTVGWALGALVFELAGSGY